MNALYLWCIAQEMPTEEAKVYNPTQSIEFYTNQIKKDRLFGFVECDIYTPDHLKSKFENYPLIFKNATITYNDLTDDMKKMKDKNWKTRTLVSSHFGEKVLLYTPLIKFYLQQGMEIRKIHQIVEYTPKKCFENFVDEVSNARRDSDKDPNKKILGECMKLIGNSAYGRQLLSKEKFCQTKYVFDEKSICKKINNNFFKDLNEISEDCCEISMLPNKVNMNVCLHIGFSILQLSKLKMLDFYYNCLNKYADNRKFNIVYQDTDSNYMSLSENSIDEIIKPQLKEEFEKVKHKYFVVDDYGKREPGLMKVEWSGKGFVGLNSKCYYCSGTDEGDKLSSKGVQKRNNLEMDVYKKVLFQKKTHMVKNMGFRCRDNSIFTYEQDKCGLSPFYAKRGVNADNSTYTLHI